MRAVLWGLTDRDQDVFVESDWSSPAVCVSVFGGSLVFPVDSEWQLKKQKKKKRAQTVLAD